MSEITTVGVELAKEVIVVCASNAAGAVVLRKQLGYHKTLVAIANKHLRMIWATLAKGEDYDPNAWQRYRPAAA